MTLKDLQNKKIAILGLGIENQALIKYLLDKKVSAIFTICDARHKKQLGEKYNELKGEENVNWRLGKGYDKDLSGFDLILHSPGYPLFSPNLQKLDSGNIISSSINLFFDLCPSQNIIGITGTKGKGSTASLIYHIFKTAKKKVWLGGNIGVAPFSFLAKIKKTDWVILELSSFQLEDITDSPHLAVITNFTKEHLAPADPYNPNYHKSMRTYWLAKLGIAKWQTKSDYLVVNKNLKTKLSDYRFKSKLVYFTKSDLASKLPGEHNKENIAAAVAVAKLAKIKQTDIEQAVKSFNGLEYRLELVRDYQGVKYYNDSFATTPEATITALKSFQKSIILLAGGADKGADFKILAKEIKRKVKFICLLEGQATPKLKSALFKIGYDKNQMKVFKNIKSAVKFSYNQAKINEIVLLSPACASFGMFKNYKERGKLFTEEVDKLK